MIFFVIILHNSSFCNQLHIDIFVLNLRNHCPGTLLAKAITKSNKTGNAYHSRFNEGSFLCLEGLEGTFMKSEPAL